MGIFVFQIRAKEAAKMEAAMMRNPQEDKRQKMLQKLPEMMRILRAVFVQEKKPALQKSDIITKVADSCRSAIAIGMCCTSRFQKLLKFSL